MTITHTRAPAPNLSGLRFVTTDPETLLTNERVLGPDVVMRGLLANRPAPGTAGRLYLATDVSVLTASPDDGTLYRDNGGVWQQLAPSVNHAGPAHALPVATTLFFYHDFGSSGLSDQWSSGAAGVNALSTAQGGPPGERGIWRCRGGQGNAHVRLGNDGGAINPIGFALNPVCFIRAFLQTAAGDYRWALGMCNAFATATQDLGSSIYFRFRPSVDVAIMAVANGAFLTALSTGVVPVLGTALLFEIEVLSGGATINYYINNVLRVTLSGAQVPGGIDDLGVGMSMALVAGLPDAGEARVDYIYGWETR